VLDDEVFAAEKKNGPLHSDLRELVAASKVLEQHAAGQSADFRFLSRSLGTDFYEALRRFDEGRPEEARFFVVTAVQNCVLCHSRLPKQRDFALAERLTDRIHVDEFPPEERALYFVATRAFEKAMATWEAWFSSPEFESQQIGSLHALEEYLRIAIRVELDPERAERSLRPLAARPDLPDQYKDVFAHWIAALRELEGFAQGEPSLAQARRVLGDDLSMPQSLDGLVQDLAASHLLIRFIDAAAGPGEEVAEAYYLLGVIEARAVDSFWHPQTEFHLDTSIRMAPGSPFASDAYALLIDYTELGYGGSAGVHLPSDVAKNLRELLNLIESAQPASSTPSP
jgi:hypothetical protein